MADKLDNLEDILNFSNNSKEFTGYAYWCKCLANKIKQRNFQTIQKLQEQIIATADKIIGDREISLQDYYANICLSD